MAIIPTILSGSTNGRGIKVTATGGSGTTIHTCATATGTQRFDEITLFGVNMASATAGSRTVTVRFGGTGSPADEIKATVPPQDGLYTLVPGLRLRSGAVVRAIASNTSSVIIHGFVNRNTTG